MSSTVVAQPMEEETSTSTKAEDPTINTLQQQLQLEPYDNKFLTKQEILLWELFEIGGNHDHSLPISTIKLPSSVSGSSGIGISPSHAASTSGMKPSSGMNIPLSTTPKRPPHASDRERVQHFMAQRQHASGNGEGGINSTTPIPNPSASSSSTTPHTLSAMERAKQLMAMKGTVKPLGRSSTSTTPTNLKRINPLADILKGPSVVGSSNSSTSTSSNTSLTNAVKRPRTYSSKSTDTIPLKPGEIRFHHGRHSIQLPMESYLHQHDWYSTHGTMLKIILPEVAFATNNTLVIHATIPIRPIRCRFNISTHTSFLEGAPYPGTVLYHFNPRHRGHHGQIMQNSNINGRWGCIQPMPRCPITFGEPFILRLTIVSTGFLVFIDEIFQDEFLNRVPIREGENLVLTVPSTEEHEGGNGGEGGERERGDKDGIIIHHVWWGHADAPTNLDGLRRSLETIRSDDRDRRGGRGSNPSFPSNPYEIYVGNLPPKTTREEVSSIFQSIGCESVRITARGFGFVSFANAQEMHRAVEEFDGYEFHGMKLRVSIALGPK